MKLLRFTVYNYRVYKTRILSKFWRLVTQYRFLINGVEAGKFITLGLPLIDVHPQGVCKIGDGLIMVNKAKYATLGKCNRCKLVVAPSASLVIGKSVGMSNVTIVANASITLGNNIMIGGGTTIVDSDFHSMNPSHWHSNKDLENMISKPVSIEDNVFIGMNAIILKGVNIGSNSIIAAGSLISRDIPCNEVWGGNPAKFIKSN